MRPAGGGASVCARSATLTADKLLTPAPAAIVLVLSALRRVGREDEFGAGVGHLLRVTCEVARAMVGVQEQGER
jgi:hypothetical protein